ncbi:hypothetical protein Ciccas_003261 [Cichlidogyrus casuarinus]|uniref:Uncharacterized protein n=1 Tax=Cichlidogyrus casuarinus TaxID=1844966 RepID=A0ABD2QEV7_9PLAT
MRRLSINPRPDSLTPTRPVLDDLEEDLDEHTDNSITNGYEAENNFGRSDSNLSDIQEHQLDPYDPFEESNSDGTMLSGILLICVQDQTPRSYKPGSRNVIFNLLVGICQLFTITLLFVGWFWSLAWGVEMILRSTYLRKRQNRKNKRNSILKVQTMRAFLGQSIEPVSSQK